MVSCIAEQIPKTYKTVQMIIIPLIFDIVIRRFVFLKNNRSSLVQVWQKLGAWRSKTVLILSSFYYFIKKKLLILVLQFEVTQFWLQKFENLFKHVQYVQYALFIRSELFDSNVFTLTVSRLLSIFRSCKFEKRERLVKQTIWKMLGKLWYVVGGRGGGA